MTTRKVFLAQRIGQRVNIFTGFFHLMNCSRCGTRQRHESCFTDWLCQCQYDSQVSIKKAKGWIWGSWMNELKIIHPQITFIAKGLYLLWAYLGLSLHGLAEGTEDCSLYAKLLVSYFDENSTNCGLFWRPAGFKSTGMCMHMFFCVYSCICVCEADKIRSRDFPSSHH